MVLIQVLNGVVQIYTTLRQFLRKFNWIKYWENVFDKRLSPLEKLSVVQLREECEIHNLSRNGYKGTLVKRLQMVFR